MKKINKIILIVVCVAVVVGIGSYVYFSGDDKPDYEFVIIEPRSFTQEVDITGKVKPSQELKLAFEKTGKIAWVGVEVGDRVFAGQGLVSLENADILAQLNKAKAGLSVQTAELEKLKTGTRQEEIQVAEIKLSNAQKQAVADLEEDYANALSELSTSLTIAENAIFTLTDLQYAHFMGSDQESSLIGSAKSEAIFALYGASNGSRLSNDAISKLESNGAKATLIFAQTSSTYEDIDKALGEMKNSLEKIKAGLDAVPISSTITSTEETDLNTEKTNVNTEISAIEANQQAITVQKATNESALATAQAELALKKAPATQEQLNAQEAKKEEAKANVQNYEALLAKTIIYSPIYGIIAKQEARVGEIIASQTLVISLISDADFEIEAYAPEVDMAKITAQDTATVTLDAYGEDVIFTAKVVFIEPAETLIDGAVYYKLNLVFDAKDARIRSGMSADIIIETDRRENIISVPYRAVVYKEGGKIVRVLDGDEITEQVVETGLKGRDGLMEIIQGIKQGDKVITFIKND
jgi:RND family efflux transporter MFP subunit